MFARGILTRKFNANTVDAVFTKVSGSVRIFAKSQNPGASTRVLCFGPKFKFDASLYGDGTSGSVAEWF